MAKNEELKKEITRIGSLISCAAADLQKLTHNTGLGLNNALTELSNARNTLTRAVNILDQQA